MRVLVTGGAGFIGSNFVQYLLRTHLDDQVVVVDKLTYAGNLENLGSVTGDPRFKFIRLDICDPSIVDVLQNCDMVVHCAAESHVDRSIEDASPFVRTNVEGTWQLISACRVARISRFLHVSTDEVYGSLGASGRFSESSMLAPTNPYAASKAASDLLVLSAVKTHGFAATITRCTNNYGPFQFPEKFIPLMIIQALADKPLPLYGDGRNVRDWIHVEDHCRALDVVLRKGRVGEIYNVSGGYEIENINVAHKILRMLGKSQDLLIFVTDRLAHDRRYALDCSKLRSEIGWQPIWDFRQGLADTVHWYQNNRQWLKEYDACRASLERQYLRANREIAAAAGKTQL